MRSLVPYLRFDGAPEFGMAVAHETGVRVAVRIVAKHLPHPPHSLGHGVEQVDAIVCVQIIRIAEDTKPLQLPGG